MALLKESILRPGTIHRKSDNWTVVASKQKDEWRGVGIAHKKSLGGHRHTIGHPGGISTTICNKGGSKLGCLSGHIPHHATISETGCTLAEWGTQLGNNKLIMGMDANEQFAQPVTRRQSPDGPKTKVAVQMESRMMRLQPCYSIAGGNISYQQSSTTCNTKNLSTLQSARQSRKPGGTAAPSLSVQLCSNSLHKYCWAAASDQIRQGGRLQWSRTGMQGVELLAILRRVVRMAKDWGVGTWIVGLSNRTSKKHLTLSDQHGETHSREGGGGSNKTAQSTPRDNGGKRDSGHLCCKRAGDNITFVEQTNGVRQGSPDSQLFLRLSQHKPWT